MSSLAPESVHALLMAMKNERNTVQIYEHMLKHVQDSEIREMLHRLIVDEHDHEQRIREKIGQSRVNPSPEDVELPVDFPDRTQVLEMELENCSVPELVNLALESEQMNRDFYKIQLDLAKNTEVREIFKWLFEQEEKHIIHLKKEYGTYLS